MTDKEEKLFYKLWDIVISNGNALSVEDALRNPSMLGLVAPNNIIRLQILDDQRRFFKEMKLMAKDRDVHQLKEVVKDIQLVKKGATV